MGAPYIYDISSLRVKKSPTSAVPSKRTVYSIVEKFQITVSVPDRKTV